MDAMKLLFRHGTKVAILGLFALGYGFQAQALVVDIDITSTAAAEVPGETDGESDTIVMSDPGDIVDAYAEVGLASEGGGRGETDGAFAWSRGNGAGSFGVRANGSGTYSATATFQQAYTITNDDPFAQALSFLFDIENGSISADCGFGGGEVGGFGSCTGTDFAQSEYAASITLNGAEIWNSAAIVRSDASGSTFTHFDTPLNTPLPPSDADNYSWAPQSFLLDIGTIEVADEWSLLYSITTTVLGQTADGCGEYYYDSCAMSYAQFGDPSGLSSTGGAMISSAPPVPVPAPFLLVAGGLVAIAAIRRRRHKA